MAEVAESLEKVKKPRSEKQLEAFKKAQEKRKENCELMKEVKEQHEAQKKLEQMKIKEELLKRKVKAVPLPESDSESEEEVVIVKHNKTTKKKKIVVVEPESEEEEEPEVEKVRCARETKPMVQLLPPVNKLSFY